MKRENNCSERKGESQVIKRKRTVGCVRRQCSVREKEEGKRKTGEKGEGNKDV